MCKCGHTDIVESVVLDGHDVVSTMKCKCGLTVSVERVDFDEWSKHQLSGSMRLDRALAVMLLAAALFIAAVAWRFG